MLLAVGRIHQALVRAGLRLRCGIVVETGEARDVHQLACLIGYGATAVFPSLAYEVLGDLRAAGELKENLGFGDACENYRKAAGKGLLKTMSKMGISVISSYRGGANFEALGLSRTLVAAYFPSMPSRISGIGMTGIQHRVVELHRRAWNENVVTLPVGGFYKFRKSGETHAWAPELIHTLQSAAASESYQTFKRYSEAVAKLPPVAIRDLLDFVARLITAYTNTRIATVSPAWTTVPDATTTYFILPVGRVYVNQVAADAIDAGAIKDGAIDAATFAANAITSTVIADDAITAAKLNTGAITADAFAADAIVAATLATGAITADAFAADAIVAATLATGAISADAIAANAITSTGIADDAITAAKINTGAITADAFAADAIVAATLATGALLTTATLANIRAKAALDVLFYKEVMDVYLADKSLRTRPDLKVNVSPY